MGGFSSRKIAVGLEQDVAFRVQGAGNFPAHRTIREFRQLHLAEFEAPFVQVVQLAREAGLVKLGRVGIDGTKIRASASRHKAMSYTLVLPTLWRWIGHCIATDARTPLHRPSAHPRNA